MALCYRTIYRRGTVQRDVHENPSGVPLTVLLASTGPTPLMDTVTALVARQVSVTTVPGAGLTGGFAVKDVITADGTGGVTFTNTVAVAGLLSLPIAVQV